mmetsp:Transcript_37557/g.69232  ORF Transcript_37557/g.69232 Transcript_37557/m.69232 type:complete len:362 (-) Transcript_37557:267-1352(-)|eukprot:CAMPEP_0170186586 /NCGR_PEP_ID=MMETSP0040_2-20121228/39585_1 /TAXON_ID=641309 /ORGANISM="Lotharella oceanica, Strain CCMP622" /LENGTH=361 /DNA_ID=CAMNT_0010433383 /DNA_START=14 /DNA_END=1099 /DNA_ORIENTATION=-
MAAMLPQTGLEQDTQLFEPKKLDDSYKYGRSMWNLGKGDTIALGHYDGELLHFGTHKGKMVSLDISGVTHDGGRIKEIQSIKLLHGAKHVDPSCMDVEQEHFVVGDTKGNVSTFSRVAGKCALKNLDHKEKVSAVKMAGDQLFHTGFDGYLLVRNMKLDRIVHSWISTKAPLSDMIVQDSSKLIVSSWDSSITQIDLRMKSCEQIRHNKSPIRKIKLHEEGNIIVAAHGVGGLRSIDLRNPSTPLKEYGVGNGHTDVINHIVLQKDRIFTAADDLTVRLFDVNQDQCLERLQGHSTGIMHLCLSGDLLIASNYSGFRKYRMTDIDNALAEIERRRQALQEVQKKEESAEAKGKGKKKKGKK